MKRLRIILLILFTGLAPAMGFAQNEYTVQETSGGFRVSDSSGTNQVFSNNFHNSYSMTHGNSYRYKKTTLDHGASAASSSTSQPSDENKYLTSFDPF